MPEILRKYYLKKEGSLRLVICFDKFARYGAPERIRTSDLCLRRAALYPAELRVQSNCNCLTAFDCTVRLDIECECLHVRQDVLSEA